MRSGSTLTQLVEFSDGFPDGTVTWSLLNGQGLSVAAGAITPAAGSASVLVTVSGGSNTIGVGALTSPRELNWAYGVGGLMKTGRYRYRLEAFLPFGISEDGVRRKLGVEVHELVDNDIDLVGAYARFRDEVGIAELEAFAAAGDYSGLIIGDAIEAAAAINVIPSLQIKLAAKESSGTNQFARAAIDWNLIAAQLQGYIADGYAAIDPQFDPTADFGALLLVVVRADPVTGATA